MPDTPSVEEVKERLVEEIDVDEEEFHNKLDNEYIPRFNRFNDEGFAAWAMAKMEYGVEMEAGFDVPISGSGGAPDEEDLDSYTIGEITSGEVGDDEYYTVEGYVLDFWRDRSSKGKPQRKLRLIDRTGTTVPAMAATGMDAVKTFDAAELEHGEYIRIISADSYSFEPDDDDDAEVHVPTIPPFVEFKFPEPEYTPDEIATEYLKETKYEGDFVTLEGVITKEEVGHTYTGCLQCSKKYDTEEYQACPSCGEPETTEMSFDTILLVYSGQPVKIRFSPGVEFEHPFEEDEDIVFNPIKVYGTYQTDDDGEDMVEGLFFEFLDEDPVVVMEEEEDESESESEDEDDISIDELMEEEEENESEDDVDMTDEEEEIVDYVVNRVEKYNTTVPGTVVQKLLSKSKYEIEDEETSKRILHIMSSENGDVSIVGPEEVDAEVEDKYADMSVEELLDENRFQNVYAVPQ